MNSTGELIMNVSLNHNNVSELKNITMYASQEKIKWVHISDL